MKHAMLSNHSVLLFLLTVISLTACQQNISETKPIEQDPVAEKVAPITFLIYGVLPPAGYVEEKDSLITLDYGFRFKRLAGCEVTQELVDSIAAINQENKKIMQSKYGEDWKQAFETASKMKISFPD